MGAQQRERKQRIRSAQGMTQICKAPGLSAASRSSKAHARVLATTPYADAITRAIGSVATHSDEVAHPFLQAERSISGRSGILLITADRGMAGAYSPNAIRAAEQLANTLRDQGKEPVMYVVGRKDDSYYRFRDRAPHRSWTPYKEHERHDQGGKIDACVSEQRLSEDLDRHLYELHGVLHRYQTQFVQKARWTRLEPLGQVEAGTDEAAPTFTLFDISPDADTVFEEL